MEIEFRDKKFERICNNQRLLKKQYGTQMAKRIGQRLYDLRAASDLEEMRSLPGRCHELLHDRTGQLSLDLEHPRRLIFEPANEPIPRKADGGIDWTKVTTVIIIGIDDTHD